jgi:hypothetical protein
MTVKQGWMRIGLEIEAELRNALFVEAARISIEEREQVSMSELVRRVLTDYIASRNSDTTKKGQG